jgi:hypothetical protein
MSHELATFRDSAHVEAMSGVEDLIETGKTWQVHWTLEKWHDKESHAAGLPPHEVIEEEGNLLLNAGITQLLRLLTNIGPATAYSSGVAYIKVGNSSTAASASQTDLQGGSVAEMPMDAGYPAISSQTATWRATFDTGDANFAWEEVGVKNASGAVSSSVVLLNRKVQSFGTKASGAIWTMTLNLTIA